MDLVLIVVVSTNAVVTLETELTVVQSIEPVDNAREVILPVSISKVITSVESKSLTCA